MIHVEVVYGTYDYVNLTDNLGFFDLLRVSEYSCLGACPDLEARVLRGADAEGRASNAETADVELERRTFSLERRTFQRTAAPSEAAA